MNPEFAEENKVPGAQLLARLINAFRPPQPTPQTSESAEDVFDRMRPQLEAIQELRVWRAVRQMPSEPIGCPPTPRLLRQMVNAAEEEHVKSCPHCQGVLKSMRDSWFTTQFERLERRWRRFKETRPALHIRAVQAVVLTVMVAAGPVLISYPLVAHSRRLLSDIRVSAEVANGYSDQIAALVKNRNELAGHITELHSLVITLDQQTKRSQKEQAVLSQELRAMTQRLNAAGRDRQKLDRQTAGRGRTRSSQLGTYHPDPQHKPSRVAATPSSNR
jgi:hypothetical protein